MIRRIGGAVGRHALDGPGFYASCAVAAAALVGTVRVTGSNGANFGTIAASAGVGTRPSGGTPNPAQQLHQGHQLFVDFTSGSDFVDVDFTNAYG